MSTENELQTHFTFMNNNNTQVASESLIVEPSVPQNIPKAPEIDFNSFLLPIAFIIGAILLIRENFIRKDNK